jgi:putative oxidoreductase
MASTLSLGLLVLRLVAGLTLAAHGLLKVGWFGGASAPKTAQGMQKQGFKPAWLWTSLTILGEVGGGLSLAFGFLTPLGAAGAVGAMFMAIVKVHWKHGFWNRDHGLEFPLQLLASSLVIGLVGPGSYSLDALWGIALRETPLFGALAVAALLVDVIGLLVSRPAAVARTEIKSSTS